MWAFLRNRGVNIHRSDDFQALGRVGVDGQLIGVVGYSGFCGLTCYLSAAGTGNWVSRELIRIVFDYPFRQLGMEHLFASVAESNKRALRFDQRMGFRQFGRIKNGWDIGEDLIVLTMAKQDCRWLEKLPEREAA
jgi:RimJ/RimL family protein N-acetyltransferase